MDIVHLSLERRPATDPTPAGEVADAVDVLWAHAGPDDGLEHASGRAAPDRLDLLLYLRTGRAAAHHGGPSAEYRAAQLIARCYRASHHLQGRYLAPAPASTTPPNQPPA
ncbi:hypothetical protein [Streptacidiphilus cavernicola]|uniref:Uncharacterized protein n=1 Tax=Streptacidiphilus cavernicola TaxID=3342716 RepID=A0ABV6W5R0_9ACTN